MTILQNLSSQIKLSRYLRIRLVRSQIPTKSEINTVTWSIKVKFENKSVSVKTSERSEKLERKQGRVKSKRARRNQMGHFYQYRLLMTNWVSTTRKHQIISLSIGNLTIPSFQKRNQPSRRPRRLPISVIQKRLTHHPST